MLLTEAVEDWVGRRLPEPYRSFLETAAVEMPVGDRVLLYGRDVFVERNETFETKAYCVGYVTVGDDGGGKQFLLSLETGAVSVVDAGAMTPDAARDVAGDFGAWYAAGCPLPDDLWD